MSKDPSDGWDKLKADDKIDLLLARIVALEEQMTAVFDWRVRVERGLELHLAGRSSEIMPTIRKEWAR